MLIDSKRVLKAKESDWLFEPQIDYILHKEVDICLDMFTMHSEMLSFLETTTYSYIDPDIAIIGSIYPTVYSNPVFGIINIFYTEV